MLECVSGRLSVIMCVPACLCVSLCYCVLLCENSLVFVCVSYSVLLCLCVIVCDRVLLCQLCVSVSWYFVKCKSVLVCVSVCV